MTPARPAGADPRRAPTTEPGATAEPGEVLDCRGQRCPLPVIALARRLPDLPVGAVLRVLADDPAAAVDIPAWCRMRGQEFVTAVEGPGYDVRRIH
ncbi:tRNA 2-thiouridine synthesizing protein A [Micromonospora inyonensis]|uniref:tRNA 2-thiouridine synthesizing protein A n=1 Tax=Micromonospora inyonensis TaxID=47866 RepID=A0A1C6S1A2_9ACTN|nr:tRNA 2-thiouridine synthesizing protein A [Micromonospora inyonensis]